MPIAIDGDWCHAPDGRRFSIRGPDIVTPGGKQMQGDYSRHAFSYAVPAPEPGAGKTVFMTLLDENTVHLRLARSLAATGNLVALFAVDQRAWRRRRRS